MNSDSDLIGQNDPDPNASHEFESQASQTNPYLPVGPSVPSSPPPKTHCEVTYKQEKTRWQKFKEGVEILGIVLLAVYTLYTIKMYHANKESADAARTAAKAAQCAAKTASETLKTQQQAFNVDERPWVGLKDAGCTACTVRIGGQVQPRESVNDVLRHPEVSITISNLEGNIVNTGKTPAEGVRVDYAIHYGWLVWDYKRWEARAKAGILRPGFDIRRFHDAPQKVALHPAPIRLGVIVPGQTSHVDFEPDTFGAGYTLPSLLAKPAIYVEGTITYRNDWGGKENVTRFCFFPMVSQAGYQTDPNSKKYEYCDTAHSNEMK